MGGKQKYVLCSTKDADIEKGSSKSLTNKSAKLHCRLHWKTWFMLVVAFICISLSTAGFLISLKLVRGSDAKRLGDLETKVDGHENQIETISSTLEGNDKKVTTELSELRQKFENNSEEQEKLKNAIKEIKKELQALKISMKNEDSKLDDELKSQSQKLKSLQETANGLANQQREISSEVFTLRSDYNSLSNRVASSSTRFSYGNSSAQNKTSLLILLICVILHKTLRF